MIPQIRKDALFKCLGYTCMPTLLILFFYWEGLVAYFNGLELWALQQDVQNAFPHTPKLWRPVFMGLNILIYMGFGLDPLPHRVVYLIPFICLLILLYLFYNQLNNNKALSVVGVILFTSFYLNAEIINNLNFHHELLVTTFTVATLVCFCYYKKICSRKYYILALFSAILACLSKETACTLPLFLLSVGYHVSHGIFPPKLPPLNNIGRAILPYLPFFLVLPAITWNASHFGAITSARIYRPDIVGTPFYHYIIEDSFLEDSCLLYFIPGVCIPFSQFLANSYWCIIYSLSPCFVTDRLTIMLAFSIIAGLVWLFYRSPQRRSLIVALVVCWGVSLFPYIFMGAAVTRYMFLPSVFTMFLVALLAFEISLFLYKLLGERLRGYQVSQDLTVAALALLILLPAIYLNYKYIRQSCQLAVHAGELTREVVKGTIRILPHGPGKYQVIYINFPGLVQSSRPHCTILSQFEFYQAVLAFHYRQQGIKVTNDTFHKLKAVFVDLGYRRVKLSSDAWYNLESNEAVTVEEYNNLLKDENNKLLFFNPGSNKIVDVSGWSYEQLAESIYPYKDRLGLSAKR